jgi:hypothetical protein
MGSRAVPFYCPYCGEEDIVPEPAPDGTGSGHGHWACRSCRRAFRLSLTALAVATSPAGAASAGTPGAVAGEHTPRRCAVDDTGRPGAPRTATAPRRPVGGPRARDDEETS